jgi:predicted dehydrogenase
MKPVKWGVLGAANFAREHMAPAIHMAKGAELYALATSSPQKAEGFTSFCPGLKIHDSYEALLADPEVEAVYIPLPNHLHVIWTLKAIAAGKHVLCEKPIALHAREIEQIVLARDASKLLVAEAYMIVQHPQWIRAREWVQAGEIGKIRHVDAAFSFDITVAKDNIRNKPETGGGSLRDIGVYTFGAMRFVTGGEPVDVQARMIYENKIDTWAQVSGVMEAGKTRFTYSSMTSMRLPNRQEVTFQGDKGMIRLASAPFNANIHDVAAIELHKPSMVVLTERFPTANQYVLQVEAFGRSLRDGVPYPCPLEFVKGTQAMMDRAYGVASEVSL